MLLCFLLWLGALTVYPTSGLAFDGALWADSAHTNQGVQWKAKMRCTALRSELNHLSSENYTAPKGERKALKMKRARSEVPCGSDLLIISMVLVDFVLRYYFFFFWQRLLNINLTVPLGSSPSLISMGYSPCSCRNIKNMRPKCLELHWALSFSVVVHLQYFDRWILQQQPMTWTVWWEVRMVALQFRRMQEKP